MIENYFGDNRHKFFANQGYSTNRANQTPIQIIQSF